MVPPDPIPNSEVKRLSADGSVGFPHVRVGHCQVLIQSPRYIQYRGLFYCAAQVLARAILIEGRAPIRGALSVAGAPHMAGFNS